MNSKIQVLILLVLLATSGITSFGQTISGIKAGTYLQKIKTEVLLPGQAEKNIVKLFSSQGSIVAVTSNGVFRNSNGKWTGKASGANWRTATLDSKGSVWLASSQSFQKEDEVTEIDLPESARKDTILCMLWEDEKTLDIGTTSGLLTYNGAWTAVPPASGKRVNSIVKDSGDQLWVATTDGLLRRMNGHWINMDDDLMAAGLKRKYFALESRNEKKEILFGGLFTVGCIAENGDNCGTTVMEW
ncbi:MAG: hypothetical protein Q8N05_00020 [Bacteroidota bacterium]|nr:hypothetical protein [Bacteroidota bacterium]